MYIYMFVYAKVNVNKNKYPNIQIHVQTSIMSLKKGDTPYKS